MKYDFSGYVTRADVKCSDGRTIMKGAFSDCNGAIVPLVWNHLRSDPTNVLGKVTLEHRADGVYGYCQFNNTEKAQTARELVKHGDIRAMSIYANDLTQRGHMVEHGSIKEVSLVVAGANPGAFIDNLTINHGDDVEVLDDEAIMYFDYPIAHSDEDYEDTEDQEDVVMHEDSGASTKTCKEVFETLNEDQKKLFYAMVGEALSESSAGEDSVKHSDEGGEVMHRNVFEGSTDAVQEPVLSHSDIEDIFRSAQKFGSLKDAVEEAAIEHGIDNIEILFPEAKGVTTTPEFIGTPDPWVNQVWNATRKSPFSRIKSSTADITKDEARAKGYIKGNKKVEEQFSVLKRVTTPQTVYKKQKLDRDDIIDITDFDVVQWMKGEMRLKLNEELARAVLLGDGRLASDDDKISEDHIRSVYHDDDMYSIKYVVDMSTATTDTDKANAVIDAANYARKNYKGSGAPTFYVDSDTLCSLMLAKDKNGRRLYNTMDELASALRVSSIVEVPLMEKQTRESTADADKGMVYDLLGIIVNLSDYVVGADRGGEVTMFDDFDIDYNQNKYLMETRCSGALVKPYSAIVLEKVHANG